MARDNTDITYRGNRRLSGNFGRVWLNNNLVFEISSFEAKITADRDDVIIGISKDSKITSLTGEGTITTKKVFTSGLNDLLRQWQEGHDPRVTIIAELADPDTVSSQKERVRLENCWFNDLPIMNFSKGEVIEQELTFGFTPEDAKYENSISINNQNRFK